MKYLISIVQYLLLLFVAVYPQILITGLIVIVLLAGVAIFFHSLVRFGLFYLLSLWDRKESSPQQGLLQKNVG